VTLPGRQGHAQGLTALTPRHAALIFALALLPRLAHFLFVRHTPLASEFVPDLSAYLYAVDRLMHSAYFFVEPMLMSPGYALLLAGQYILVGPNVAAFVLVNAVLDAGSAALCARLAAQMAPPGRARAAGLWAGGLYACCGPLVFYHLLPLGEGPSVFCLLLGLSLLFAAARPAPKATALTAWLAGAVLALAALIRPNLAPAELLALAVWWGLNAETRRTRGQIAVRCLLGFFLVLAPFMAHNAKVAGRASPFGFQGGFTLYTGNHPGASGVGDPLPGFENTPYMVILQAWQQAEERTGRQLTLSEADGYWYDQTWRFFLERPAEAAGLMARKVLLLVNRNGVDATANQDFCARFSPVPGLLALPAGLLFALGVAGLWLHGRRSAEGACLAVLLLSGAALVVLFQVTPRYRVVLLPLCIPFAAQVLSGGGDLFRLPWRGRDVLRLPWRLPWRQHAGPLVLAVAVLAASFIPLRLLVDKPGIAAAEHARLAHYYLLRGPQSLASVEFAQALLLGAPDRKALEAGLAASLLLRGQDESPRP